MVYLEILPNRLEVQFLQPVLVFVRVFHFWLRGIKIRYLNTQLKIQKTHRIFSSRISASLASIKLSTRADNSVTFVPSSSNWSSTLSLRLDWFREDRHDSPMMRAAATANRKPSAMVLAPFSIALEESQVSEGRKLEDDN